MDGLLEKLEKYNISQDRYQEQSQKLIELGFTQEMAGKLIIKKSSEKSVNTLIDYFDMASKFLTHQQMAALMKHYGGGKNLLSVITHKETLRQRGFSYSAIVKMAANSGGSKNIESVMAHYDALRKLGFADPDIVKMAANIGGTQTIEYIIENQSSIAESSLSCSDIATKCNANSGHARLKAFLSRKASVDA